MITAVADTPTLIWYLSGDRRLSDFAKQYFDHIAKDGNQIAISTISIIEIFYLAEKGRLFSDWPERVLGLFDEADSLSVAKTVW